ncbi:MAG: hypothetical protein PUK70_04595 [Bacteroidales bacterium]|nr:hypothetical protein [Bacteroidales bacterium]MDY6002583.1 hypothetical protein [Candidatus Cryptobacteroides sp.]
MTIRWRITGSGKNGLENGKSSIRAISDSQSIISLCGVTRWMTTMRWWRSG